MTTLLDIIRYGIKWPDTGAKLADKGMARALKNERFEWRESVLAFAEKYAKANQFFRMENIHYLWTMQGGADPHSDKVWGGIARGMVKRGYCEFYMYVKAVNVKSHGNIITLYKSKIYDAP